METLRGLDDYLTGGGSPGIVDELPEVSLTDREVWDYYLNSPEDDPWGDFQDWMMEQYTEDDCLDPWAVAAPLTKPVFATWAAAMVEKHREAAEHRAACDRYECQGVDEL